MIIILFAARVGEAEDERWGRSSALASPFTCSSPRFWFLIPFLPSSPNHLFILPHIMAIGKPADEVFILFQIMIFLTAEKTSGIIESAQRVS